MSAQTPPPLVTTQLAQFREWFQTHFQPGQAPCEQTVTVALDQIDLLTMMASAIDKELAVHREIMDGAHARRLALRLTNGSETVQ